MSAPWEVAGEVRTSIRRWRSFTWGTGRPCRGGVCLVHAASQGREARFRHRPALPSEGV